jgi:signal transduction histidine kinase
MGKIKERPPITDKDILSSFRAGVLVIDREGNILFINEIGKRILNLSEDKAKVSHRDPFFKVLISSFDSEYLPSRIEMELTKGLFDKKIIGITLSDIRKRGERKAIVAFFKDLSHIEELSQAEGLKSRLVVLGQMAAAMAHEIRNPLASINIHTELIKKKVSGNEMDSLIDSIIRDIEKVEGIVNQSLDFVKHDQVVQKSVTINPFLEEIVESVRRIYTDVDFQLATGNIDGEESMMVDKKLFTQAIQNILFNAAQSYGGGSGKVLISANVTDEYSDILKLSGAKDLKNKLIGEYRKRYLNVSIKDFGPGIKDEIREKIFTPFFTTRRKGTGIGLPISQKIIHSHNGNVDVVSREGRGTEFRIKLPVK